MPSIKEYIVYRQVMGKELNSDLAALKRGKRITEDGVQALSTYENSGLGKVFFTGIVDAEMKKVCYNVRVVLEKTAGGVMNEECDCPAGKCDAQRCRTYDH
jgi:hypothetical protein